MSVIFSTAVLSVSNSSGRDNDSGLGVSADVIVFGKEIENIGRSTHISDKLLIGLLFLIVLLISTIYINLYWWNLEVKLNQNKLVFLNLENLNIFNVLEVVSLWPPFLRIQHVQNYISLFFCHEMNISFNIQHFLN